jgi:hypothetical protein
LSPPKRLKLLHLPPPLKRAPPLLLLTLARR